MRSRALLLAVALWSLVNSAFAGATSRSEFQAFLDLSTGGTSHTVGFANGGTPVVTNGIPGAASNTAAGNMNFTHAAGGAENLGGQARIPTPTGSLPLNVRAPLSPLAVGKALGHFAMKVAQPLAVGFAIYDLIKELGYNYTQDAGGNEHIYKSYFAGDAGYEYDNHTLQGGIPVHWGPAEEACRYSWDQVGNYSAGNYGVYVSTTQPGGTGSTVYCKGEFHQKSNGALVSTITSGMARQVCPGGVCPANPSYGDETEDSLASAIAAQSGWPSGSNIDRALADAISDPSYQGNLAPNGLATLTTDTPTQLTGAPYNTVQADGSTRTDTQTCAWVVPFNLGTAEWKCWTTSTVTTAPKTSTQTVTVVTSNPDGTTSTSTQTQTTTTPSTTTTSTTTGTQTPDKVTCGLPGTPACKIDETGTLGTVTMTLDETTATTDQTTKNTTITGTADKGWFSSWSGLWAAPPLQSCVPIQYPAITVGSTSITPPAMDPCPVVTGMRSVMAFVWAFVGFWLCLGMVREVI